MPYRYLGPTGIKVSLIGYGNMLASHDEEQEKKSFDVIKRCYELGINYFDTAEAYGDGKSEIHLGKAIKMLGCEREDIVVSTKIFQKFGVQKINNRGLSRKHLIEGTLASL